MACSPLVRIWTDKQTYTIHSVHIRTDRHTLLTTIQTNRHHHTHVVAWSPLVCIITHTWWRGHHWYVSEDNRCHVMIIHTQWSSRHIWTDRQTDNIAQAGSHIHIYIHEHTCIHCLLTSSTLKRQTAYTHTHKKTRTLHSYAGSTHSTQHTCKTHSQNKHVRTVLRYAQCKCLVLSRGLIAHKVAWSVPSTQGWRVLLAIGRFPCKIATTSKSSQQSWPTISNMQKSGLQFIHGTFFFADYHFHGQPNLPHGQSFCSPNFFLLFLTTRVCTSSVWINSDLFKEACKLLHWLLLLRVLARHCHVFDSLLQKLGHLHLHL